MQPISGKKSGYLRYKTIWEQATPWKSIPTRGRMCMMTHSGEIIRSFPAFYDTCKLTT